MRLRRHSSAHTMAAPTRELEIGEKLLEKPISSEGENRESSVHDFLMKPVEITDDILAERAKTGQFSELAFELLKETAGILYVCSCCRVDAGQGPQPFPRNQAICVGLLVRITKFVRSALAILSHGDDFGEVILALWRCIAESVINLRYLILKDDPALYEQFALLSLSPEREMYDVIQQFIKERNGVELPIEKRMLYSIGKLCQVSGVNIQQVDRKYREWGGGIKKRLKELDMETAYAFVQRVPSHAIHGTWADLILHHLKEDGSGFDVKLEGARVDTRLLGPICLVILSGVSAYAEKYLGTLPDIGPLLERINNLEERVLSLDAAHEDWYQKNRKLPDQ